jgi:hypothetical protein
MDKSKLVVKTSTIYNTVAVHIKSCFKNRFWYQMWLLEQESGKDTALATSCACYNENIILQWTVLLIKQKYIFVLNLLKVGLRLI